MLCNWDFDIVRVVRWLLFRFYKYWNFKFRYYVFYFFGDVFSFGFEFFYVCLVCEEDYSVVLGV